MKKVFYVLAIFICSGLKISAQTANWSAVLPNQFPTNVSGQIHGISRVSQMKFHHSNSLKRYAVSARGGLFITTNGGNNWTIAPGCDFMPYARFASVCIDHTNDQIIYLGTGDNNYYYNGLGVWKSTNGGTNFTQTGLTNKLVVDMIMDPLDNQKIVAITNTGIYKTNNAGTSWSLKTASRPFKEILIKATGSRTLYAASADSAFFRSTDFGETWSQINNGIVMPSGITNGDGCRIAVSPADTNVVYFAMVSNGGMLYKSVDGGSTFTARKTSASPYLTYYSNSSSSSGQGDYNFGIGVDRLNANIVYMVAHNNWKSLDGGLTWTQLTNWWEKCHTDMHQIVTSPYNNNELYNMNDGGVFLSTDGGNNWTPKSNGIYGYEIYHGNCSPTRRDMISIGTQDNGELYSTTAGWFTNRGGDWGSQCAFDYRPNSSMVYYLGNNQRRLVTGGDQTYGLPSRVVNLDAIEFHRSNSNLAFVADSFIYRSTNLINTTPTWTQIAALGKIIRAMHVAFSDPNRLYIITNDGKIHVSANALSASPTFTVYNLPSSSINRASITTIKNSPGTVYITANTNVYRSTNFGATWTNITHNLPSFNHIKIIADEYYPTNELVLLATGSAVYYKVANANSWTLYNQNLPSRPEGIDLSIYNDSTTNTILRVATYGRGMWESAISNLRTLNAQLSASTQNPCVGQPMQFFDISTGNVISRTWSFPGGTPSSSTLQNPTITYSTPGVYNVGLTISNGTNNSSVTQTNYITTFGASLPFVEGFEGTGILPDGWQNLDLSSSGIAWAKSTLAGGYGNSATSMMFDNYSWNYPGEKDELITPKLNLQGLSGAKLYFDLAYQVFSGYSDSLAVFVSTDCGLNYTKVYQKGGTVLSTAGSAGNNFVPTASQWRTDTISLNPYTGQQIVIKIQNINGYGNKLYLDNINIQGIPMAAFSGLPTTICAGQTVSFTNNSTGNPTTYLWSFPGGTPSTSTSQNPVVSYPLAGNYAVTLTASNANGANTSTLTNYIQVNTNTSNTTTASACSSYTWSVNNQTYTQSGTYSSVSGCHTEILNLTITPNTSNTSSASACSSYTWSVNNQTYTQSGTYSSVTGCNTEILNLTITPNTSNTTTASACSSYTWSVNTQTYTQSGTYSSVSGCHTEILNLTITPNTSNTTTASACSSYTWSVNNQTYTQSGTYSSVSGCHIEILNLTITPNTINTTTASACSSYTWSVNNQTYTQSGTYSSVSGCHTEILILTLNITSSNTSTISSCGPYTWPVNNAVYTQSGTYVNNAGCQQEILQLNILPLPVVQAQDVYACQGSAVNLSGTPLGGVFSLNNPYTGPSTSYSYTFTDNNGCTATSLPANVIVQNALPVTGLFVSNVGANSVTINWVSVQGLQWYEVRYRPIGAGTWTGGGTQGAPTTFKNLVGLDAATDYEIEVRGFCSAGTPGPWSSTFVFSTGPSCPSPQNLNAINVLGNQVTLTWSAVSNVLYYQVRYRIQGGNSWSSGTSNSNSKVIVSLQANTTYEWQLRAVCLPSPFSNSSWSMIGDFSTNALKEASSFEQEESFSIFPNPASQILHVQFNSSVNEDTHIAVFDLSGRKMKQIILGPHEGSQQIDIDISDLVQGTYLIQWKTANSKSQQLYFNKVQ